MKAHILLVEDDTTARMLLADVLQGAGYYVTTAQDGETALALLKQETTYDVVITDIRMRDVDGIHVLQAAKQRDIAPSVILLTGFGSLETAVAALRSGAQDYLLKPVAPDNLLSHVARALVVRQSHLRQNQAVRIIEEGLAQLQGYSHHTSTGSLRSSSPASPAAPASPTPPTQLDQTHRYVHVGALVIDKFRHVVSYNEQPVHLTPIEYALLSCLAETPGRVISYRDIVRCSHGHDVDEAEAQSLLKAHIRNMRRKITADYLINVRGTGYMLVEPQQGDSQKT
jgi:DNA-binding response OmpR family regulator